MELELQQVFHGRTGYDGFWFYGYWLLVIYRSINSYCWSILGHTGHTDHAGYNGYTGYIDYNGYTGCSRYTVYNWYWLYGL